MTQGERVKEIRKSQNLTLEEFGKGLNVQRSAISKIENGDRALTDRMIKDICRVYHVNYDWLVDEDGEMFDDLSGTVLDELCNEYDCDDTDRKIIEEYLKLDSKSRQILKNYMKNVFGK